MDLKKIGAFIAACRKRHKLTQLELAEELGVTDRSVSNLSFDECDKAYDYYMEMFSFLVFNINEYDKSEFIGEKGRVYNE